MPSFSLWLLWIGGGIGALISFFTWLEEGDDVFLLVPIIYVVLSLITIPWYLSAADIVHALPDIKERVGIVETTTLPGGGKISIVKTEKGIINLSDSYHVLIPDGAVYYTWKKQSFGKGIEFCGAEVSGSGWGLPEDPALPKAPSP